MKSENQKLLLYKDARIISYSDQYWDEVKTFIKRNWREDHPICNKELFDWQFRGFGDKNKKMRTFLLFNKDKLIGFRGTIPGLYQVPVHNKEMKIVLGGSSAMWSIDPSCRRGRFGFMLLTEALKAMNVITGLNSNPKTSLLFYIYAGFTILNSMHRYVAPLEVDGYYKLLAIRSNYKQIREWTKIWSSINSIVKPNEPNINEIASVWEKTTFPLRIFSLYRNADFWRWRYLESAGYRYLFFGEPKSTGIIVARVEEVITTIELGLDGQKIFRIIEIVPSNTLSWRGEIDINLASLLQGAINWAIYQGCVAVDFYCSTTRLEPVLFKIGLKKYDINKSIYSLAPLFQPLKYVAKITNSFFRVNIEEASSGIKFEDTYMVKSDSDMDRPNVKKNCF